MAQVLLVGKGWQARALLRAQLIEEGVDVEGYETVAEAVASLEASPVLPALLVADLSSSDSPVSDAELLSGWTKFLPTWVLASRSLIVDRNLKGRGFELILFRPLDIGELVEQIKQRLGKDGGLRPP
jgi:CheY-like chemotaxis protein